MFCVGYKDTKKGTKRIVLQGLKSFILSLFLSVFHDLKNVFYKLKIQVFSGLIKGKEPQKCGSNNQFNKVSNKLPFPTFRPLRVLVTSVRGS